MTTHSTSTSSRPIDASTNSSIGRDIQRHASLRRLIILPLLIAPLASNAITFTSRDNSGVITFSDMTFFDASEHQVSTVQVVGNLGDQQLQSYSAKPGETNFAILSGSGIAITNLVPPNGSNGYKATFGVQVAGNSDQWFSIAGDFPATTAVQGLSYTHLVRTVTNGAYNLEFAGMGNGLVTPGGTYVSELTLPGNWSSQGVGVGESQLISLASNWTVTQDFVYNAATNTTAFVAVNSSYVAGTSPNLDIVLHGSPAPVPEPETFVLALIGLAVLSITFRGNRMGRKQAFRVGKRPWLVAWFLERRHCIARSSRPHVKSLFLTTLLISTPAVVCAGPQLAGNVSAYNWDGTGLDFQLGQSTSTSNLQFAHQDADSNEVFFAQAKTWANATQVGNLYTNAIYTQDSGYDVRDYEGGFAGASSSWSDSLLLLSPPSSVEPNNVIVSVKMVGFLGSGTSLFFKVFSQSSPTPITASCAKENAGSCSFEASMTAQQAEYVNIFEELSSSIACNPGYSAGCGGEASGSVSFMSVDLLDAATRQPLQYVTSGGETLPSLATSSVPEARTDLLALVGLCAIAFTVRKRGSRA